MEIKKFKEQLFSNVGYILIVITSVMFILLQQVIFPEVNKSIWDMIRDGMMVIVISTVVSLMFSLQGMINGLKTDSYIKKVELHKEIKSEIKTIQGKLQEFCDKQNSNNLISIRTDILSVAGIGYSECFDENGKTLDIEFKVSKFWRLGYLSPKRFKWWSEKCKKLWEEKRHELENLKKTSIKKKALKKAVKANPAKLTVKKLLFRASKNKDKYDYGDDLNTVLTKKGLSSMIISIVMAIIVGYYGYPLINNWNFGLFIWSCIQITVILTMGLIKMYLAYLYILNNYCGQMDEIIGELYIFKSQYSYELKLAETTQQLKTSEPTRENQDDVKADIKEEVIAITKKYIEENYMVEEKE